MAVITNKNEYLRRLYSGHNTVKMMSTGTSTASTVANSTSGFNSMQLLTNAIGGTFGTTLVGVGENVMSGVYASILNHITVTNSLRGGGLCRVYKIGTLNLTATGDQFTHNAATFPLLRKNMVGSSEPVTLLPLIEVSTALTTTAAAFQLQTNGGGAGYVNQDGSNIIGTKTFTFPSATTLLGSCFSLRLEDDDYSIRDITQIKVTTAAATGACTLWGMELISTGQISTIGTSVSDLLNNGMLMRRTNPAVATSGTVDSCLIAYNTTASGALMSFVDVSVKLD